METPLINGPHHSWSGVSVEINGERNVGVTGVTWSDGCLWIEVLLAYAAPLLQFGHLDIRVRYTALAPELPEIVDLFTGCLSRATVVTATNATTDAIKRTVMLKPAGVELGITKP